MSVNLDPFIGKTPGFPRDGITFYDISPILEDGAVLKRTLEALSHSAIDMRPDLIAGVDARGFLFALPLGLYFECGAVMIRKAGKLPGHVHTQTYDLEYGTAELALQESRQITGKRVVLCDDLLATGGTLDASARLIEKAGGVTAGAVCIIELTGLKGRDRLSFPVAALQQYKF